MIVEPQMDPERVARVFSDQINMLSREITSVWSKIQQVVYLDSSSLEGVYRQKYEQLMSTYYSQMVVEYRYEEDIEEHDDAHLLHTSKSKQQMNMIQHSMLGRHNKDLYGSTISEVQNTVQQTQEVLNTQDDLRKNDNYEQAISVLKQRTPAKEGPAYQAKSVQKNNVKMMRPKSFSQITTSDRLVKIKNLKKMGDLSQFDIVNDESELNIPYSKNQNTKIQQYQKKRKLKLGLELSPEDTSHRVSRRDMAIGT